MIECARKHCPQAPGWWCPRCMNRYPHLIDLRVAYPVQP